MLQQLPKELQDLVSELIEEAEFKGKQVLAAPHSQKVVELEA